jgi:hypothetical protein
MKILLSIIVILIIIIFIIVILNHKIYFSEDFQSGSYNQNTIEDIIPISYLPFNPYLKEQISEYEIIEIYKKILDRSPTIQEIKTKIFLNKDELTEELYNSFEYEKMIKIQDNLAITGIENSIAKRNLIKKIIKLYKETYNKDPQEKILIPLRDCYLHLRSNIFLFLAFIQFNTYPNFEKELLTMPIITKKNLLELFNKYYNLLELKILAEEKIKKTRGNIELSIQTTEEKINYETLKDELNKIVDNSKIDKNLELQLQLNSSNTSNILYNSENNKLLNNLNILSTSNLTTTTRIDLEELKKYFSNKINNIEPFENKGLLGNINNVYNNTQVGNIFTLN